MENGLKKARLIVKIFCIQFVMGLPVKKRNLFYRNRITFDSNPRLSGTLQTVAEAVFPFWRHKEDA
jgi:hypothetical protein